jgi:murein DD-endopeptidase MepM/ murein hydrolase activator NlpD
MVLAQTNTSPGVVVGKKTPPNPATDYNNAYIDPTNYNIGATGYSAPSKVVLSERSTGCKAVLRPGQGLSGSLCGATAIPRFTAQHPDEDGPRFLHHSHHRWARSRAVAAGAISPIPASSMSVSASRFHPRWRTPTSFQATIPSSNPVPTPGNPNTGLLFPLTIPAPISSVFGWRTHPITRDLRFHSGTDLGAPLGTPVLAAYAGQVEVANPMGGYGLTVVLNHNKPFEETLYGHLSQIFVQPGQWVEQGTVIGRVGSTGNSTGPHLHFEVRQLTPLGWVATDPGAQLQYAMAHMVQALHIAQLPQQPGNRGVEKTSEPFGIQNLQLKVQAPIKIRNSPLFAIGNYSQNAALVGSSGSNAVNSEFRISSSKFILPLDLSRGLIPNSQFAKAPNLVDPGAQLQYAMVQLVQALHTAQLSQQSANKG